MENLISIDFGNLAIVANKLIDKLSSAVGWVVNHDTLRQQSKAVFVESVKNNDSLSALEKSAYISNANKIIREYANQENIIKNAINNLSPDAQPENVSDDWLSFFFEKSKIISDEEFQLIWGKILAEECNEPNSIPRTLLHILSLMDSEEAEYFTKLRSFCITVMSEDHSIIVPVVNTGKDYFREKNLYFGQLLELEALGLLKKNESALSLTFEAPISISYYDQEHTFGEECKRLFGFYVTFSYAGEALARVVSTEPIDGFLEEYCVPYFIEQYELYDKMNV